MTLQVGRVSLDDTENVDGDGSALRIAGEVQFDANHLPLRRQLLGLVEAARPPYMDEPIIPVTWDQDELIDGFYAVEGVSVSPKGGAAYGDVFSYSIDLRRVTGNPSMESIVSGAVRANSHSITSANVKGWHAVPYNAGDPAVYSFRVAGSPVVFTGSVRNVELPAGASAQQIVLNGPSSGSMLDGVAAWTVKPADFYVGAAQVNDSAGNVMIGRGGSPLSVSNGTVRATITTVGLAMEVYDTGAWVSAGAFSIDFGVGSFYLGTARVLRNSPELVVVRVSGYFGATAGAADLDLSLRRGSRVVECTLSRDIAATATIRHGVDASSTALTGGQRATSNDASGNRWLLTAPGTFSAVTATAGVQLASGTVHSFGVGVELDGSGAAGSHTAQNLIYQYMAAQAERQMVVQR